MKTGWHYKTQKKILSLIIKDLQILRKCKNWILRQKKIFALFSLRNLG